VQNSLAPRPSGLLAGARRPVAPFRGTSREAREILPCCPILRSGIVSLPDGVVNGIRVNREGASAGRQGRRHSFSLAAVEDLGAGIGLEAFLGPHDCLGMVELLAAFPSPVKG
jgi:hypothetical protein